MYIFNLIISIIIVIKFSNNASYSMFHNGQFRPDTINIPEKISIHHETIHENWINMKVDNFDANDNRTWPNRYLSNDQYYGGSMKSPIFLMLRGENSLSVPFMYAGAWVEYAKIFHAMLFQLEHRFYGESIPTKDLSIDSLTYLTIDQTLADIANFIKQMNFKYKFNKHQKWIIFGGSYAGALALWFIELYPNLGYGAISSSATVFATINFSRFFPYISEVYNAQSLKCSNEIKLGFNDLLTMMHNSYHQEKLFSILSLSSPLINTNNNDKINLLAAITNIFAEIVQLNNLNTDGNSITINMICEIMTNNTFGRPIERIGLVNKLILQERNETVISYNYNTMIHQLRDISINSLIAYTGSRQWFYQACTELGFFQTTTEKPYIFGNANIPLEFYVNKCYRVFGRNFTNSKMTKFIENTNNLYGGKTPYKLLPTVLCVDGSNDPWNQIGIIKPIANSVKVILIPGSAHCADMYSSTNSDSPQLAQARLDIIVFLQKLMFLPKNIVDHVNSSKYGLLAKLIRKKKETKFVKRAKIVINNGFSSKSSSSSAGSTSSSV